MVIGAVVSGSGFAAASAGFRLNVTPSIPLGIWRLHPAAELKRGDTVTLCLPDTELAREARRRQYLMPGSCPGDFMPLIKPVAAIAGDKVRIAEDGIEINGIKVPDTQVFTEDPEKRALTAAFIGTRVVPQGMVFVLSNFTVLSFDSRYFGMIPIENVKEAGGPFLTTDWKPEGF
jgi:conjugative transfer signal peptidase TraF